MDTQYYFLYEVRNVLFAHLVSHRLAAVSFARPGSIALASHDDLQALAGRRKKLLHVTGLPSSKQYQHTAEPVPA